MIQILELLNTFSITYFSSYYARALSHLEVLADHWSLTVNGNWRVIFKFEDGNAYVVNYLDYH